MNKRSRTILIYLFALCFILPSLKADQFISQPDLPDKHMIEDVPYISQETSFYCLYACPTMAMQYQKVNITLQDVLYSSGVGYTMIYSHPSYRRVPLGGNGGSWWNLDRRFLAVRYGLSYTESRLVLNDTNKESIWEESFHRIKENISSNIPVVIQVDPIFLPSFIDPVLMELGLENIKIPELLLKQIKTGFFHVILLVGYDELKDEIYYHDPMAALFGHQQKGTYASVKTDNFKHAMFNAARNQTIRFGSFINDSNKSQNKTTIFLQAHERNIEKLKGNPTVYDPNLLTLNPGLYGIQVLYQLHDDLTGVSNQIKTSIIYQLSNTYLLNPFFNIVFQVSDSFFPQIFKMSDWQAFSNYYYQLSVERSNISQYLLDKSTELTNPELKELCMYESNLLGQESLLWKNVSILFNEFMKKGLLISLPTSLNILSEMDQIIEHIITIENNIIKS